jgi:hypothetical protein
MGVSKEGVYQLAWLLLKGRIEQKTSWGRNELADIMKDCLLKAYDELIEKES